MKIKKILTIQNVCSVSFGSLLTFIIYNYLIYNLMPKVNTIIGENYLSKKSSISMWDNTQLILIGIFLCIVIFILPIVILVKKDTIKNAKLYLIIELIFVTLIISFMISIIKGKLSFISIASLFIISVIIVKFLIVFLSYTGRMIIDAFLDKRDIGINITISIITSIVIALLVLLRFR